MEQDEKQPRLTKEGSETAAPTTGPKAPTPSLPKGGGAIRGIGEKFAANPVTGMSSMSVPIATSPGRSGFHPELPVRYDSGSGNGPFGLGWQLSTPRIARKTDKGLPQYGEEDVFILSDTEDLVPVTDDSGNVVPVMEGTEKVFAYRPRVEGLFARIQRRVRDDGSEYWRAVTRDNVTSLYGTTTAAQIADPDAPSAVFAWLLEKTFDDRGNVILYVYKSEDLDGVSGGDPSERHRLAGLASVKANRYLKRVRYGNKTPAAPDSTTENDPSANDFLFEVVFDFGDQDLAAPTPEEQATWAVRLDPFSVHRSTFEVRTYRLCHRALMFHTMSELGESACLVGSTDFTYDPGANLTKLVSVAHTGYIRDPETLVYTKKSHPAVEFGYEPLAIQTNVEALDRDSLRALPAGLATPGAQAIDLDGEGIPGVFIEQNGSCYYKRNLGGRLAAARRLPTRPLAFYGPGSHELMDVDGDGRKELVELQSPMSGYYERTADDGWGGFRPFASQPMADAHRADARLIDLTGDGHEDLLVVERTHLVWYPSLAKGGFGPPRRIAKPSDEERGPSIVLTDEVQTIFLADMTGDGLVDLVRIRNGSVCYWPNRGFGSFGAKVTMAVPERFDGPSAFDPRRVKLADIDGSGTTDLLYVHAEGVRIYLNQAGNSLAASVPLPKLPSPDLASVVQTVDLRGNGTACVVWSSPQQRFAPAPLRFIDLTAGKKPHLLISIKNNLGLETKLTYASSTKFYLADLLAGRPWATKLPFPVHVLESVETYDWVSKHRLVTLYSYHHGYYDGVEREFRGFGRVEQRDAESFSADVGSGVFPPPSDPPDPELYVPPVVTKTWFHTGAWIEGQTISQVFATEYYKGDTSATLLDDTILPAGLSSTEAREAARALKGGILRQEIYSDDGTALAKHPYSVSERSYLVRRDQHAMASRYGVFFVHSHETIDYHYERNPADPRITHALTLNVDDYGVVTRSAAVAYARRDTLSPDAQSKARVTLTEIDVVHQTASASWYRIAVPIGERSYELTGLTPVGNNLLVFADVLAAADAADAATTLDYEAAPASGYQRRRLSESRHLYYANNLSGPLDPGDIESLALPYESYAKAFTPGQIADVFAGHVPGDAVLIEGGYVQFDGDTTWWVPSGRQAFDADHFYLPITFRDPFGNETTIAYDTYHLLVLQATDAIGNVVSATQDYRTLSPSLITDPNGNRAEVKVDALGVVVATAVKGKDGSSDGDTLDDPTTSFDYDLDRFATTGLPVVLHASAREIHGPDNTRFQDAYSYFDGMGREIMRKVRAEPGDAPERDGSGHLVLDGSGHLVLTATDPRWVGTGRVVLDNKGNPVKQYEPFFSSTYEYEDEDDLVKSGVTPILHYDPLGRLIRTDLPNGSYSKVEFDPWKQITWDPNDTVFDPASPSTTQSLWYQNRIGLSPSDPEYRAANLTANHAGTATVVELDVLGRVFKTTQDAGSSTFFTTLTLDIEGNTLALEDARTITAMTYVYAMGGRKLKQISSDAGTRWMLTEVQGKPLRSWDSREHVIRPTYDALRRPLELFVTTAPAAEIMAERTVWGEGHPDALADNLRGKVYRRYDGAGVVTTGLYDFKGNLLTSSRRLLTGYTAQVDWPLVGLTAIGDVATAAESLLESETFDSATAYDALNRPTSMTAPDTSEIRPTYNVAGLLDAVDVRIRGAAGWTNFVSNLDYNAKGQREKIVYGNGTITTYTYDPLTFRLTELKTTRTSDGAVLQDLTYTYDPVGNIVAIGDGVQQTVFFNNAVVSASNLYEYDPLYRLTSARGREHISVGETQVDQNDVPIQNLPDPSDSNALRNYRELYEYDGVGNILRMIHQVGVGDTGAWTRGYDYATDSNRLRATSVGTDDPNTPSSYHALYSHNNHGNMDSMPHLASISWDFKDQMQTTDAMGGGNVYFTYDAAGQRVRKVWVHAGLIEERIYLGPGYEVYRKIDQTSNALLLERQTLHVMDDKQRIAMVETKTVDTSAGSFTPTPRFRFQLGNHLGSAALEVDETGLVISYEEYHPYGTTSYHSVGAGIEVSARRYRYTGKERDEETGLYYHGARYYACWLGRWTSSDPSGMVDGPNPYQYVRGNPVGSTDPTGTQSSPLVQIDENTIAHFGTGDVAHHGEGYIERYNQSVDDRQVVMFGDNPISAKAPTTPAKAAGPPAELKAELAKYGALPEPTVDESQPVGLSSLSGPEIGQYSAPLQVVQGLGEGIAQAFAGFIDFAIGKGPIESIKETAGQLASRASNPFEAGLFAVQAVNPFFYLAVGVGSIVEGIRNNDPRGVGQGTGQLAGAIMIGKLFDEFRAGKASELKDFPKLDRGGKVHGVIPEVVPEEWTAEEMQQVASDLRKGIPVREAEQVAKGETSVGSEGQQTGAAHRVRIESERDLLRQLERRLGDMRRRR